MGDDLETARSPGLICEECGVESDARAIGWEGHLSIKGDGTESVAFFCPECVDELSRDR